MNKLPQTAPRPDLESATILNVSATSHPPALAEAIADVIREYKVAKVQADSLMAIDQAISAIAVVVEYLATDNLAITWQPYLVKLITDGEEYTAIQFVMESQPQ